jgi:hypothetical protein
VNSPGARHSPARVVKPILIKPLTPGSHRLPFSGTVTFNNGRFVINTDYSVNVGR